MLAFTSLAHGTAAVALALALGACATGRYLRSPDREPGRPPGSEASFVLIDDGEGGCMKKAAPDALYGQAGKSVTWSIRNDCKLTATVRVSDFNEKGTIGKGPRPFKDELKPVTIPNGGKDTIVGYVQDDVKKKHKGLHVYRYKIRIRVGNSDWVHDPEIVIEWPY